jgi:hypothetical protein
MRILLIALTACESKRLLSGPPLHFFLFDIQVGMTREEILRRLGEPGDRQTIDQTEFLFYYTPWMSTAKANERSPIAIVNGVVMAMGSTHYYDFLNARGMFKQTAERQG